LKFISFCSSLKVSSKYVIIFGNIIWIKIFIIVRIKIDANMHVFLYIIIIIIFMRENLILFTRNCKKNKGDYWIFNCLVITTKRLTIFNNSQYLKTHIWYNDSYSINFFKANFGINGTNIYIYRLKAVICFV